MGKIVKLLLPFILVIFAFGGVFDDFDNKFTKANKQDRVQIYHELKGVYLNSILNDNDKLKLESLKRLVSGGKILKVDYSVYAKELSSIQAQNTAIKDSLKPKIATKNSIKESKNNQKNNQKDKSGDITYKVLSISSSKTTFILNLNSNSSDLNIKSSQLNQNKTYRKIFDFNGVLTTSYKNKKDQISDQIRIAQFNKEIVRVVFTDDKSQDIEYKLSGNSVIFTLKSAKNSNFTTKSTTQKATTTKKSTQKSDNAQKATIKTNSGKNKIVVLDAGHGGKDAGAVGKNKLYEKNVVLNIALEAGRILKNRGYKVYYTRSSDKFINLRNRTSFANEKKADIFISIHANAAPNEKKAKEMQGIETYFLSPTRSERSMQAANLENKADTDEMNYFTKISYLNFLNREKIIASNKLAIDVQSNLLGAVKSKFKVVDGGVREAPFWVLVGALMPAVLIEAGYITHTNDHKLLSDKNYTNKIALGIANGIDDYFAKNQ
ncbi:MULTISPECIES: N-acetylmuramoyl-L-alanine amidase family protein [Campylobacter]|uniref:N-acetylmuramoyl-L-alanine amidase n=1 Tax=Campylobacter porcelli TaxID=1660073 RepID=A0ABU7M1Y4_9BACT|nr:N-acetylmuramoyl-L-alanine amidase [Campylobacter sp. P0024]MCR8678579.1 N-acetylmuramoyl-L-alanine amidase [Campylobacter sp. RM19072]MEE3704067.1 N-acetylmuramoyl-L-alanine amidase [Campylobacter sp. CX2-8023-23]MEE3743714.1 N-acetylmuramoyl-L-alanine amidase [Campylobacter sp. CX2-4855-23]MEE3775973.1 N-acetylmuramoyl-L-alanine amidase [Campylobacter sp. CX2-4080-23]